MARVSHEKTTDAAEAILDRVVELAPDVAPENLEHLARSVALIAEHLNTNPPTSGRSAVVY